MLVGSARRPEHYRFGSFTYGELDLRLLRSRVEYVGSDFYDRCGEALRGRLCISRDQREISAIPVNGIRITVQVLPAWGSPIHRILDDYYQELADAERRQFALELDRQQAIFGAAGVGTLSGDTFGRIPAVTDWITVITRNQRKAGWVTPDQVFIGISTPEPKVLADGYDALRSSLQLFDWGERSIDAWIQTYCEYITTAQAYEESGRIEEALLHLVFSLGHLNSKTHSA